MVRGKKEKKETREEFTGAKKEAPSPLWASREKEKKSKGVGESEGQRK